MSNDYSTFSDASLALKRSFDAPQEGVVVPDVSQDLEGETLSEEGVSTPVSQSPFVNRLRGTAPGQVVVKTSPGSFAPKNKIRTSPAGSLLNARMSTSGNAPQVGGELRRDGKRLLTFREQQAKMVELADFGEMLMNEGFEGYTNGLGETVVHIPEKYQNTIIQQVTDELTRAFEKQSNEKIDSLLTYFARLESIKKDAARLSISDLNKRISTIETILDGAKKDRDSTSFKRTLSVAGDNLDDLEELIARELKALTVKEKNQKKIDAEALEAEKQELAAALRAQQKAQRDAELVAQKASDELLAQKEALGRLSAFSSHLLHFKQKETLSESILPYVTDELVSSALESGARELNNLFAEILKNPSAETISSFVTKLDSYASLIDTATKNESTEVSRPEVVPKSKEDAPRFFGTMDGWPSVIKQEKGTSSPSWVLTEESGKTTELSNSALWSTLASNYDDTFKLYQDFFEGVNPTENIEKMKLYHALVLRKNELNAALLNLDTDRATELISYLKQSIEDAEKRWNLYLEEERKKTAELKRQKDLLDRLQTFNSRYEELITLEASLGEYTAKSNLQKELDSAKSIVTTTQLESEIFKTKPETITDDFVNSYRGQIEEVSKLLVTLKEEQEEGERLRQAELVRVTSIFESTKDDFTHVKDISEALLARITSQQEIDMVESRLRDIENERTKLENAGTDITEEMVKLYAKHIRDFNTMLSSASTREDKKESGSHTAPENINHNLHEQSKEGSFVDAPITRTLNSDGTLTTDEGTPSASPLDLTTLKEKGDKEKEIAFLAQHFDREYRKDPEHFKNFFHSTILNLDAHDKNRMAAEMVVANVIREIENKIKEIEAKQTERDVKTEDGQLKDLEQKRAVESVRRLRREIEYLVKADTKPNTEESKPVNQPFKNRLKFSGVRSVKSAANDASYEQEALTPEESSAKVQSEPAANETEEGPKIEHIHVEETETSPVNQEEKNTPPEKTTSLETGVSKMREASVARIINILFKQGNATLGRMLSPTGDITPRSKVELARPNSPETLGQFASWKNFPELEKIEAFTKDFAESKLGLKLITWEYAKSLRGDTSNTSSLATLASTMVYDLINGDGGAYGHDETKRKELSDIVFNLDLIARATQSKNSNEILGEEFSSLRQNETFESYYSRVLHLAEQANLKEEDDRIRARARQDMLKKAA